MQKPIIGSPLKYFRKDRIWPFLKGMFTSAVGVYTAWELFFSDGYEPVDYVRDGMLFIIMVFAAAFYWMSLNMYLVVLFDRIRIKGWWQEIDILFKDIEKCEFHSPNYSKCCVLHLRKSIPGIFRFSAILPLTVLGKDRKAIALSSFLSEQDWPEFERIVCENLKSV